MAATETHWRSTTTFVDFQNFIDRGLKLEDATPQPRILLCDLAPIHEGEAVVTASCRQGARQPRVHEGTASPWTKPQCDTSGHWYRVELLPASSALSLPHQGPHKVLTMLMFLASIARNVNVSTEGEDERGMAASLNSSGSRNNWSTLLGQVTSSASPRTSSQARCLALRLIHGRGSQFYGDNW